MLTDRWWFLKTALKAGAVLAAPYVIPSTVLGKDGAVAPSDRIAWGSSAWAGKAAATSSAEPGHICPAATWAATMCRSWRSATSTPKRADEGKARVEKHYAEKSGAGSYHGCTAYIDIRDMVRATTSTPC